MCCSQGFLKGILGFFTFITTGVGIAGIVFGIWGWIVGGNTDTVYSSGSQGIFLLCFGAVIFLIGLMGVYGTKNKNRCCLYLFSMSVFPLFAVSLALAIVATYANHSATQLKENMKDLGDCTYDMEECEHCGDNSKGANFLMKFVYEANKQLYQVNTQYFGQSDDCQILVSDETKDKFPEGAKTTEDKTVGKKNFIKCDEYKEFNNSGYIGFISYLETSFQCTGVCATSNFYSLYDSTKLPPTENKSCYSEIVKAFSSTLVLIISWSLFAFFLLNIVLSLCLCCHKDRRQATSGQSYYTKMNYYD